MRGMTAPELVRTAAIAAVGAGPAVAGADDRLARQVDRIFRYTHILATALRNEMIGNGRGDELEELVRSARALHDELQDGPGGLNRRASGQTSLVHPARRHRRNGEVTGSDHPHSGLVTSRTKISIQKRRSSGRRSISIRRSASGVSGRSRPSGCPRRRFLGTSPNQRTI